MIAYASRTRVCEGRGDELHGMSDWQDVLPEQELTVFLSQYLSFGSPDFSKLVVSITVLLTMTNGTSVEMLKVGLPRTLECFWLHTRRVIPINARGSRGQFAQRGEQHPKCDLAN